MNAPIDRKITLSLFHFPLFTFVPDCSVAMTGQERA